MPTEFHGYLKHSTDGWFTVLSEPSGTRMPLPEYTKVYVTHTRDNRDYFRVTEGINRGKNCSIARSGGVSFILQGSIHRGPAELIFNRTTQKLEVRSVGTFNAETSPRNPTPLGTHEIEMPDAPHGLGQDYLGNSKYSVSWFRVGNSGDRYLHCGTVSNGCITVTDINDWDKIYKHLIISRKNNRSVGIVKVIQS